MTSEDGAVRAVQAAQTIEAATVRDQAADGSCTALLDDGTLVAFGSDAVAAGGFRLLRSGQRVSLHRDAAGAVVAVSLPGQPA